MIKQIKQKLYLILPLVGMLTLTGCDLSWIAPAIDIFKDVVTTGLKYKKDDRGDDLSVTKITSPAFATTRDDVSAEQQKFFEKVNTVQYLAAQDIDDNIRKDVRTKINEYTSSKEIQQLYSSGNNYVLGRVEGSDVHDVFVVKDDGSAILGFGVEGIFSKSLIESLSKSGEIFNTLNYLESNK